MMQRSSWIMILNHHHLESRSWVMIVDHQLESSSWIIINIESSSWAVILSHCLESFSWTTALNHHLETYSWIMVMIMICVFFDPANLYILLYICLRVSSLGYSSDNFLVFFVIFPFTKFTSMINLFIHLFSLGPCQGSQRRSLQTSWLSSRLQHAQEQQRGWTLECASCWAHTGGAGFQESLGWRDVGPMGFAP